MKLDGTVGYGNTDTTIRKRRSLDTPARPTKRQWAYIHIYIGISLSDTGGFTMSLSQEGGRPIHLVYEYCTPSKGEANSFVHARSTNHGDGNEGQDQEK